MINLVEIITVQDYREYQTGDNCPTNDFDIQSAINQTFMQLNGICNNQIAIRWPVTDTTSEKYLDDEKKNLIKLAFLGQTKYNLDYDNSQVEGSSSYSLGSQSFTTTRPKRNFISQEILNYLTLAGVYIQYSATKVNSKQNIEQTDPLNRNITIAEADAKYVPKQAQSTSDKTRVLIYNGDNILNTMTLEQIAKVIPLYSHLIKLDISTNVIWLNIINAYEEIYTLETLKQYVIDREYLISGNGMYNILFKKDKIIINNDITVNWDELKFIQDNRRTIY